MEMGGEIKNWVCIPNLGRFRQRMNTLRMRCDKWPDLEDIFLVDIIALNNLKFTK